MSKVSAYVKLLRVPGMGALGIVSVIGAISVGMYDLYNLTFVFLIGSFACVFGFLINDYADIELDRFVDDLQKKPLVSGEVSKKSALILAFFLAFSTFFIGLLWYNQTLDYYKFMALICIILAGFIGTLYSVYGKNVVGSDFLFVISVSLIFLFGKGKS